MGIITVFLNHTHRKAQIKLSRGFVNIRLTGAEIFLCPKHIKIQAIELILLNENTKFTAFSNLLPSSNRFNYFDLLETANSISTLKTEYFHTLRCSLQEVAENEPFGVKLTFDIK